MVLAQSTTTGLWTRITALIRSDVMVVRSRHIQPTVTGKETEPHGRTFVLAGVEPVGLLPHRHRPVCNRRASLSSVYLFPSQG